MYTCSNVIFLLSYLFLICLVSNNSAQLLEDTLELRSSFEETRTNIRDKNITQIFTKTDNNRKPKVGLYEKWSSWSHCHNCYKVRRKKCISKKCKNSILIEKRPCVYLPRCKRKYRKQAHESVLQNVESRSFENTDYFYTKWSKWAPCSAQCVTWRRRYCKIPGTCLQNPDIEMGYCYRDNTACHKWIQNVLSNQNTAYETGPEKPTKPKPYKLKKCGIPYRTKKARHRNRYRNMLKIMGGQITKPTKWPWHVALVNYNKEVFCGGTLIAPNWVLTAAHCLRRTLYVRLNEYDISYMDGTEIEYKIFYMYPHPNYNKRIIDNDIALLKLPKAVSLPYACLPKNTTLPVKQNCTIVGWGKRFPHDNIGSKYLREAQIPIVSKPLCRRSYRNYDITDNMFCAGKRNGGTDTCSGDSGGGFMCLPSGRRFGWAVQGITSFGESCGKKGKYGIYTDVRKYLPWIQKKIMPV